MHVYVSLWDAPVFKKKLKPLINSSEYFSISFNENLNWHMEHCQMDVNIQNWDAEKSIIGT